MATLERREVTCVLPWSVYNPLECIILLLRSLIRHYRCGGDGANSGWKGEDSCTCTSMAGDNARDQVFRTLWWSPQHAKKRMQHVLCGLLSAFISILHLLPGQKPWESPCHSGIQIATPPKPISYSNQELDNKIRNYWYQILNITSITYYQYSYVP